MKKYVIATGLIGLVVYTKAHQEVDQTALLLAKAQVQEELNGVDMTDDERAVVRAIHQIQKNSPEMKAFHSDFEKLLSLARECSTMREVDVLSREEQNNKQSRLNKIRAGKLFFEPYEECLNNPETTVVSCEKASGALALFYLDEILDKHGQEFLTITTNLHVDQDEVFRTLIKFASSMK